MKIINEIDSSNSNSTKYGNNQWHQFLKSNSAKYGNNQWNQFLKKSKIRFDALICRKYIPPPQPQKQVKTSLDRRLKQKTTARYNGTPLQRTPQRFLFTSNIIVISGDILMISPEFRHSWSDFARVEGIWFWILYAILYVKVYRVLLKKWVRQEPQSGRFVRSIGQELAKRLHATQEGHTCA